MRRLASLLLLSATLACPLAQAQAAGEWDFIVRLDGKRIGTHRFAVAPGAQGVTTTRSDAHFEVRVLGFSAYRYDHHSRESWLGDCLVLLDAATNDDGRTTKVHAVRQASGLAVETAAGPTAKDSTANVEGCVMSFAYWNAALRTQQRLLDPGTGRIVDVQVTPLAPRAIDTDRGPVNARGWRITGLPNPIDIWWDEARWIALDTSVGKGRELTYRLR